MPTPTPFHQPLHFQPLYFVKRRAWAGSAPQTMSRPVWLPLLSTDRWLSPLQDALRVHAAASGPVLQLLATSDDNGILQSCCEYWR